MNGEGLQVTTYTTLIRLSHNGINTTSVDIYHIYFPKSREKKNTTKYTIKSPEIKSTRTTAYLAYKEGGVGVTGTHTHSYSQALTHHTLGSLLSALAGYFSPGLQLYS